MVALERGLIRDHRYDAENDMCCPNAAREYAIGKSKNDFYCCGSFYADDSAGHGCCDGNVFDNRTITEIKGLRWNTT